MITSKNHAKEWGRHRSVTGFHVSPVQDTQYTLSTNCPDRGRLVRRRRRDRDVELLDLALRHRDGRRRRLQSGLDVIPRRPLPPRPDISLESAACARRVDDPGDPVRGDRASSDRTWSDDLQRLRGVRVGHPVPGDSRCPARSGGTAVGGRRLDLSSKVRDTDSHVMRAQLNRWSPNGHEQRRCDWTVEESGVRGREAGRILATGGSGDRQTITSHVWRLIMKSPAVTTSSQGPVTRRTSAATRATNSFVRQGLLK